MKTMTIDKFLTKQEIKQAFELFDVDKIQKQIIEPNMSRINKSLGQENDSRYLAYATYYVVEQMRRN